MGFAAVVLGFVCLFFKAYWLSLMRRSCNWGAEALLGKGGHQSMTTPSLSQRKPAPGFSYPDLC